MGHDSWFAGMGLFMWLVLLGIPLVLIVGVYLLLTQGKTSSNTALDELNKRYARGELNKEDYERMKSEIANSEK